MGKYFPSLSRENPKKKKKKEGKKFEKEKEMSFGGKEKSTRKERERFGYFLGTLDFSLFPLLFFSFFPRGLTGFLSFIIRFP